MEFSILKGLQFSDLILTEGRDAFLKGTPEHGRRLFPAPGSARMEIETLLEKVIYAYKYEAEKASIRMEHLGCSYRVAVYNDVQIGKAFFLRRLADTVPDFLEIGLHSALTSWLLAPEHRKGLVVVSGAQGAGKTTTAASYISGRLARHGGHAITFENPVEMPLSGQHGEFGHCFQNQIDSEDDLAQHIERSHRYSSPDVILIGEIRTKYAASQALQVALGSSQQLVVVTIHGMTVATALGRLLTWAQELDGEVAKRNLSECLLAIIHQELEETEGGGPLSLKVPEFLLVPFTSESIPIRSKLKDGITNLTDHINEQQNRICYGGRG